MAYATVEEFRKAYPDSGTYDESVSNALELASKAIDAEVERRGKDASSMDALTLSLVCVRVAYRGLGKLSQGLDVSQMSTTVGSISQQMTFANPQGSYRLHADERLLLGISGARCGAAELGWRDGSR